MNPRAAFRAHRLGAVSAPVCPVRKVWPGIATPATTLPRMVDVVMQEYLDPAVIETATAIALSVPEKDSGAIAGALLAWLRTHTHFVPDPLDVQVLGTPSCTLETIAQNGVAGVDCVDVAMLAASLARAVGINVAFVAEGYGNSAAMLPKNSLKCMHNLTHVYTIAETPAGWVQLDVQQPRDLVRGVPAPLQVIVSIP